MVLLGTLVNGASIVAGTLLGKVFQRIPLRMKETIMNSIGLAVMIMGLQMALKSEQFLLVILSLVFGSVLGEWVDLDSKLNSTGLWLERKLGAKEENSISQGFVTATLIFVIGAMGIIGSLDSGIRNDHDVLFTKAIIDGFTAIILTTTLGIGVIFSAIPVVAYQGLIAVFATQIDKWVPVALMDFVIAELTSTGGIMIVAIGLNLMGLTKVRVANLLPALLIAIVLVFIYHQF